MRVLLRIVLSSVVKMPRLQVGSYIANARRRNVFQLIVRVTNCLLIKNQCLFTSQSLKGVFTTTKVLIRATSCQRNGVYQRYELPIRNYIVSHSTSKSPLYFKMCTITIYERIRKKVTHFFLCDWNFCVSELPSKKYISYNIAHC